MIPRQPITIFLLFLTLTGFSQNSDSALIKLRKQHDIMGMSVVLVYQDSIIYKGVTGSSDYDRWKLVTDSTLFRIASISKCITATALMILYDQGKLSLDEDIGNILGYKVRHPMFPDKPITVRMVLKHTSGLSDGGGYGSFVVATKQRKIVPSLGSLLADTGKFYKPEIWLQSMPGTRFCYANLNYGIIATIVEKISGQPFDVFCRKNLFEPLGLDCSYNVRDIKNIDNLAVLYRKAGKYTWAPQADNWKGKKPAPDTAVYVVGTNGIRYAPAGGLRTNASDLAKLMVLLMNNGLYDGKRILSDSTVLLMKNISQPDSSIKKYGFGIEPKKIRVNNGNETITFSLIGHGGAAYGLIGDMFWSEKYHFGFVFLANGDHSGYSHSKGHAFYDVEEQVFQMLYDRFLASRIK